MGSHPKKLVIWHEFDGPGDTSIELLERLCREYSRQNDIQVIPEVMNISELVTRLNTVAEGGEAPQMALVPADMAGFGEKAKYSEVPDELLSLVAPHGFDFLQSMRSEGIAYGLPVLTGNHLVLYYNREIYPEPPGSWEEIEDSGDGLKKKGIIPVAADLREPYWFIPFLTAFGGWPMSEGAPSLPKSEMKRALHYVRTRMDRGLLASMNGSTELLEGFIAGEVGAIICGEWIYNHLDRHMKNKLGVARLPSIQGCPSISMSSAIGLVFPGYSLESELQEEIVSFATFMLSAESQMKWGTEVQRIPVHSKAREKLKDLTDGNRRSLTTLLEESRSMPIEPAMASVWEAVRAGLQILPEEGEESAWSAMDQQFKQSAGVL
ncbi:carbohydrate ABC transporter substrate-binding protein (CUT1 family) [Fontibacillus phaseoli]|uniref:Carbohydrate ABC transporter substrate-binding protein (CUT1 family) n=1 Tax=Fontibacillus phaseoli TaxID=1416533 RepID=A0A369B9F7_9BACL|nr:extracellular solute-binding protein [Fontibacillus phaseoli]RCX18162.1 carbohydrate ABC transporter substrate-binding protein (CUT1 family) [Fontibacillus phaseoli]